MQSRASCLVVGALLAFASNDVRADTLAILADRVITVSGPALTNGVVIVRDGKITAVGRKLAIPPSARILRAKVVMPGLVDAHSHLGCYQDVDEPVDSLTPDLRACDAFDPDSRDVRAALAAGVTTVGIAPGNGNVLAGQMSVVRLGLTASILKGYAAQKLSISPEAAGPQRNPTSLAGVIALANSALGGVRANGNGRAATSGVSHTSLLVGEFPTQLSERRSALAPLLAGTVPAFMHASGAVDAESALRLAAAHKLKPVVLHCAEAYRIADQLRAQSATAVLGPLTLDDRDRTLTNPAKLEQAGVRVAFCTDGPMSSPGSLRLSAHLAVKHGMSPAAALRALTLSGADALGVASRTGSIQVGKDADLLLLSGDPLDLTSRIEAVISGGKLVHEAKKR